MMRRRCYCWRTNPSPSPNRNPNLNPNPNPNPDPGQVLLLEDAEDVLGGFEDAEAGGYIRELLDAKMLYGSWCCSRTNFHHPGATAFFERPAVLPLGSAATAARQARAW